MAEVAMYSYIRSYCVCVLAKHLLLYNLAISWYVAIYVQNVHSIVNFTYYILCALPSAVLYYELSAVLLCSPLTALAYINGYCHLDMSSAT